jgi:radical SAM protein with 4Fe4S-binding SPASM domain
MSGGAAEIVSRWSRQAGVPAVVHFQITDRCNYDCIHCYQTHEDRQELDLEAIERILAELASAGVLFLTLGGGELFMRRDADEVLRAARRLRFAVKLLTTGHFIDERRADLIHGLGAIQVEMSFYSAEPLLHEHITQVRGSWERTLAAARRLRDRGVIVKLKAPLMALVSSGLEEVARLAAELGCEYAFDPMVTSREDGVHTPTRLRASDRELRDFYSNPRFGFIEKCGAIRFEKPLKETPCRAGQDVVAIDPQGLVYACHALKVACGDLKKQTFAEVWSRSSVLHRIRTLTWGTIEDCRRCELRAYCHRCHAMAHLEDGNLQGPSLEACRHTVVVRDLLRERGMIPPDNCGLPPPLERAKTQPSRARLRVVD